MFPELQKFAEDSVVFREGKQTGKSFPFIVINIYIRENPLYHYRILADRILGKHC